MLWPYHVVTMGRKKWTEKQSWKSSETGGGDFSLEVVYAQMLFQAKCVLRESKMGKERPQADAEKCCSIPTAS